MSSRGGGGHPHTLPPLSGPHAAVSFGKHTRAPDTGSSLFFSGLCAPLAVCLSPCRGQLAGVFVGRRQKEVEAGPIERQTMASGFRRPA